MSPADIHNKRFWCKRNGANDDLYPLDERGYLIDPIAGALTNSSLVLFDTISNLPCLVMLGEPGIGKTSSLSAEFQELERGDTDERACWFDLGNCADASLLRHDLFNSECLNAWKKGDFNLHLFLDSLDECQIRIEALVESLLNKLAEYDIARLRLRIICRTNSWNTSLEERLREIFGSVGVFLLAPLRREDVGAEAKARGFDDNLFLSAVERTGVVSLAARPLMLNFLLQIYGSADQLPQSQAELYLKGCRLLCSEHKQALEKYVRRTPTELCAAAARVAAITIFSGRTNIAADVHANLEEKNYVSKDDLVGGIEYVDQHDDIGFSVDKATIDEALQTGLFLPYGS